jgi:ribosomal-protein-alanine N-acetyltransferase
LKREKIARLFANQPTLETERLILRRILPSDAEDMFDYASDSEVPRYLLWNPHPDLAYTREYLLYLESRYAVGDFFDWAIVKKDDGKMIGTCGFTRFRYEDDCGEIGYVLSRSEWGKGYAAEAVRAVLRFGFEAVGLARIEAKFMEGNAQSLRVTEKVGMTFEGYLRSAMRVKGNLTTIGIASILRDEPIR